MLSVSSVGIANASGAYSPMPRKYSSNSPFDLISRSDLLRLVFFCSALGKNALGILCRNCQCERRVLAHASQVLLEFTLRLDLPVRSAEARLLLQCSR